MELWNSSWFPVTEVLFRERLYEKLKSLTFKAKYVTGPGRSGAIASVYTSHYLHIPYVPPKVSIPKGSLLIVDTAVYTGKTIRRLKSWYERRGVEVFSIAIFEEKRGKFFKFWYEIS